MIIVKVQLIIIICHLKWYVVGFLSDLNVSSLADAEAVIAKLKGEVSELTTEITRKSEDVERVSGDLCRLRNRLLEDGMFKYLEKV